MIKHRIRELREARGWSQERLAEAIGKSKWVVTRLEKGDTGLDIEIAERVAQALGVTLPDVLGIGDVVRGLSDDFVAYTPAAGDRLAQDCDDHRFWLQADTDVLDLAGLHRGDLILVNDAAAACRAVKPLQIVSVLYHPTTNGGAVHLLRQYLPPRQLVTNSSVENQRPLDMALERATIVGVIERVNRRL